MADSDIVEYEKESGLATRARTRLIVEGYSNLALIAVLFTGVQAQLISVTNESNDSAIEIATNAVFFGGLMFSVFTAVLAVLSGRWFSILREDDSDYLSSRWLAEDSVDLEVQEPKDENSKRRFRFMPSDYRERKPDLGDYLASQIKSLEAKREELLKPRSRPVSRVPKCDLIRTTSQPDPSNTGLTEKKEDSAAKDDDPAVKDDDLEAKGEGPLAAEQDSATKGKCPAKNASGTEKSPTLVNDDTNRGENFNPTVFDINHILLLLRREQQEQVEASEGPNPTRKRMSMAEGKDSAWLRGREWILSLVLISPIFVAVPAFALFCAGILMLAWNKQPLAVAIFTSITVFICVLLLIGFFLQHRRKHVIRKLHLRRPAF